MRNSARLAAACLAAIALVAAGCGGAASPSPASTPAPTLEDPCTEPTQFVVTTGVLTMGADNPAFPPYFAGPPAGEWELGFPETGEGFEAAVAYAVADQIGYTADDVAWVPVPFTNSFAPGPKDFDMYLSQVSFSEERAEAVDLSDGYFDLNQAVIAVAGTPISEVTTVEGLRPFGLGAPVGTTSYEYIVEQIEPEVEPSVYDTLDAAIQALDADQIDGVVVDLPTAFVATAVQLDDGVIVGQLPTAGTDVEHFSIVLPKDSPLTACVNTALAELRSNGTLEAITEEWITGQGAPELD
jgi:polar amino acid transport system substrate-binding protein